MSVEIGWVQREAGSFVVKRASYKVGETLAVPTDSGTVVFVVSRVVNNSISDAEIVLAVVSAIQQADGYGADSLN